MQKIDKIRESLVDFYLCGLVDLRLISCEILCIINMIKKGGIGMDQQQKGILTLVRAAITGEPLPLPADFSVEEAYRQILRHQIPGLAFEGAVRCGVAKTLPAMQQLFRIYCMDLRHSERQMQAIDQLCQAFESEKIDHMLMKGCHLKPLYPRHELRRMGDADVLIRDRQYPTVKKIVTDLGYEEEVGADHTYTWKREDLYLELHRRPIPKESRDLYEYFGDGWSRTRHSEGHRYELSPEDEYIYVFVHYAKHYRLGGIGLRQAIDLWVYRRAHPGMDETYIEKELDQLRLRDFYRNTVRTLMAWFEDGAADETTELLGRFIFDSGSWGTYTNTVLSKGVKYRSGKNNAQRRNMLRLLFPSAVSMEGRYRVLIRHRWLLPACWVMRWVDVLIHRRHNIKRRMQEKDILNEEDLSVFEKNMHAVGLAYHFDD